MLLSAGRSQLLVTDIQERLLPAIHDGARAASRARLLIEAARRLGIPILVSEHYPQGLGPTVPEIREALGNEAPIRAKIAFSCLRDGPLAAELSERRRKGRPQVAVAGFESHVCVLQTSLDLADRGYDVFVAADAVASRTPESREIALARMRQAGIQVLNTEMAVFEWLGRGGTPEFRDLLPLLR